MECYPIKWGFIRDLRQCIGKIIAEVYLVEMGFGCTSQHAWAVKFTDGTRAFFTNRPLPRGYAMNPSNEAFEEIPLFTPEEVAEVAADRKRRALHRANEARKKKLAQIERLKKELGLDTEEMG